MEKVARKPSTDPVQERLRQNKTNWNKEVSTFINDLIHLKKTMNGWPSKFHKERSRIVDPVPSDPATIIGSLAGDFQDIVNKGNAVIQEQLNYSKNRRRKQPKQLNLPFPKPGETPQPAQPTAPPVTPDLSKQLELGLASDDGEYHLVSQASNPLTRFFAGLLSPSIGGSEGARVRRYRKSLLSASAQMYKDLRKMQSAVVGSGPQSIFLASKLLDKVENSWVFLISGYKTYVDTLPQGASDTGDKIKGSKPAGDMPSATQDPRVVKALLAVQDIQSHSNSFSGVAGMPALREAAKKFYMASPAQQPQLADSFLGTYQQILAQISTEKQIPVQGSLASIVAQEFKSVASNDQIQIVAQRFLKKLRHQISPFDKTSSFRLDIYNMAEENRKLLDKIMDILEDGFDEQSLSDLLTTISDNMKKMKVMMHGLSSTIKGMGYQPEFLNLLEKGRLGDYGVELDPKRKTELSKMLEQKQMRELTKMYGK